MNVRHRAFGAILALTAACATPAPTATPVHELQIELQQLQSTQRVFREQNTVPQVFDFEGHGRVTVREITLDGFPGNSYLRCRFHYENRTDEPVVQAWVMLDVLDGEGQLVASQATVCIIPHPMPIARGSFVSDELRTRTYSAHLQPGWSWRIRCVAQHPDYEPLNPPAAERLWPLLPPMEIQNRGQNDNVYGSYGYDVGADGRRLVGGRGVGQVR